jgi:hypothetical protein
MARSLKRALRKAGKLPPIRLGARKGLAEAPLGPLASRLGQKGALRLQWPRQVFPMPPLCRERCLGRIRPCPLPRECPYRPPRRSISFVLSSSPKHFVRLIPLIPRQIKLSTSLPIISSISLSLFQRAEDRATAALSGGRSRTVAWPEPHHTSHSFFFLGLCNKMSAKSRKMQLSLLKG